MGKFTRQAAVLATVIAASAVVFTGTALASADGTGGGGGNGGGANANCLIPVGVTAGVIGQGGNNSQCDAVGGSGGGGGNGVG
ncbi:MAG TPA: hypothetical protein VFE65_29455 [Pseudonocardia sp.]|jgi:hypothetical protein|nr:hypothetical protein [Pseudonocardia sp.]